MAQVPHLPLTPVAPKLQAGAVIAAAIRAPRRFYVLILASHPTPAGLARTVEHETVQCVKEHATAFRIYFPERCLRASNKTTPTATDTLSDVTLPRIGTDTTASQRSRTSR